MVCNVEIVMMDTTKALRFMLQLDTAALLYGEIRAKVLVDHSRRSAELVASGKKKFQVIGEIGCKNIEKSLK